MRLKIYSVARMLLGQPLSRDWALGFASLVLCLIVHSTGLLAQDGGEQNSPPSREELQKRYEQASQLYGERKWHDAAEQFRWLSSQSPNTALGSFATVYEADCLAEDGEYERALALLSNWLGSEAGQAAESVATEGSGASPSPERLLIDRARLRLADIATRLGNSELAISSYEVLAQTALSPDAKGRAILSLGKYYQSKGENVKASELFAQVKSSAELEQFHDVAQLSLLALQLTSEGNESAVQGLKELASREPATPVSTAASFQLAQFHYSRSEFEAALPLYEKVISEGAERTLLSHAWIGAANSLYQLGRKEEARKRLEGYLEQFTTDTNWTAQAYQFIRWQLAAGDTVVAEQWLQRLHDIGFSTNGEEIVWLRTKSLWGRVGKQWGAATGALKSAVALSSSEERFELQKELLAVLLESGDAVETDKQLVAWIEECRQSGAKEELVFFEIKRMEILVQQRRWGEAAPLVKAWLESNGESSQKAEVLLVRAQCEIGLVRIDAARTTLSEEVFKSAATADRLKAQAMWLTGETYFLQKDYVSAVSAYSYVVQNFQDAKWKALAMLQAGKCYEIVGQSQDAVQLYEEALKLSPADSVKKQIEARLTEAKQTRTSSLTPASRNTIPSR